MKYILFNTSGDWNNYNNYINSSMGWPDGLYSETWAELPNPTNNTQKFPMPINDTVSHLVAEDEVLVDFDPNW